MLLHELIPPPKKHKRYERTLPERLELIGAVEVRPRRCTKPGPFGLGPGQAADGPCMAATALRAQWEGGVSQHCKFERTPRHATRAEHQVVGPLGLEGGDRRTLAGDAIVLDCRRGVAAGGAGRIREH